MKFKKIITCLLSGCLLLGLCSFESTDSSNGFDGKEKEQFDQELEALDPLLDAKEEMGDDYWVYEESGTNELSEEDIEIISPYVYMEDNHIKLDESIYVEDMKINDDGLTPSEIEESTGEPVSIDPQINYAYYVNNAKLNYVKNNMTLMNDLVDEGEGEIEDGEFVSDNSVQRGIPFISWRLRWWKFTISGGRAMTVLTGVFSLLVNKSEIMDLNDFLSISDATLNDFITNLGIDFAGEISDWIDSKLLSDAMDIVSYVSLCIDCFNVDSLINIARKILTYLMQQFLPGIVKGIYMMIGGVMLGYTFEADIGFFWSSYTVITH